MSVGVCVCVGGGYWEVELREIAVGKAGRPLVGALSMAAAVCSYKRIRDRIGWEDIDGA
jgi:hypothetical protein